MKSFEAGLLLGLPNVICRPVHLAKSDTLRALLENEMTFGLGPAGTGKTYLAVKDGCLNAHYRKVDRIVLSRPAVEAGKGLGFCPVICETR